MKENERKNEEKKKNLNCAQEFPECANEVKQFERY